MTNRLANFLAAGLLAIMACLALASIANDTLTFDEVAHIGAGYSYWNNQDYRLNPEHPPLIKDLAGLPLMALNLNFPEQKYWENAAPAPWWTQFDFGNQLLYHSNNNPDQIMFFARLGPILILILLGLFLYFWAKKLMGTGPALFLLTLFAFCPNFMAHGRLVTTDVGASFGAVIAAYFWLKFLKDPIWKNVILAGSVFGLAMLIKFSLILLVPFFAAITVIYSLLKEKTFKSLLRYCLLSIAAALIGLVFVIGPVYAFHIAKYPYEKQLQDTKIVLATTSLPKAMQDINIFMAEQPVLRPWAQYLLGLEMATNRTGTGNTTYFMGAVAAKGRMEYFPTLYLVKIPLAFHLLTLIVLIWLMIYFTKNNPFKDTLTRTKDWILKYFDFFAMLIFLGIYWFASLAGSLNIGLRHILPTFAFTYMLIVFGLVEFLKGIKNEKNKRIAKGIIAALLAWFIFSSLSIFPHYLAYYNELAGGPNNGYKIAVDSNLDWGQDLKRLDIWMQDNGVDKIYLDYFGGGDSKYYLGGKYINWDNNNQSVSELPKGAYFAVSANQMQGQRAKAAMGYDQPTDKYNWLDQYEPPITKIGYSIFVYQIK
ncbi:MAG: glycosyltransferase family 39 protein [Candidatus Paceibacterota bacterium]|jgi:4-amino-4-deoxy-L-arabinose transferase-like glycosyltransferase